MADLETIVQTFAADTARFDTAIDGVQRELRETGQISDKSSRVVATGWQGAGASVGRSSGQVVAGTTAMSRGFTAIGTAAAAATRFLGLLGVVSADACRYGRKHRGVCSRPRCEAGPLRPASERGSKLLTKKNKLLTKKIALLMAALLVTGCASSGPSQEDQIDAIHQDSLRWAAELERKRRVNANWSADCKTDAVTGKRRVLRCYVWSSHGF